MLDATVKLSKFCSLRPAHVKLCTKDFDVTSMLQVDFAENVPCDSQDEDEWNQVQVRIMKSFLKPRRNETIT